METCVARFDKKGKEEKGEAAGDNKSFSQHSHGACATYFFYVDRRMMRSSLKSSAGRIKEAIILQSVRSDGSFSKKQRRFVAEEGARVIRYIDARDSSLIVSLLFPFSPFYFWPRGTAANL